MNRVLIVDDESYIRKGIRNLVERYEPAVKDILECSDGVEAMGVLGEKNVDLVIVDIRMSGMDGLELMHRMQELPCKPHIVVLSGYGEFQYASEAIRCGAEAYLLKPVHRDELFETLGKIERAIEREEHSRRQETLAGDLARTLSAGAVSRLFAFDNLPPEEIRHTLAIIGTSVCEGFYQVAVFREPSAAQEPGVYGCARIWTQEHGSSLMLAPSVDGCVVAAEADSAELRELIGYLLSGPGTVEAGISAACSGPENLHKAFSQASLAAGWAALEGLNKLIRYEDVADRTADPELPKQSIARLIDMLGTGRLREMEGLLKMVLNEDSLIHCSIRHYERLAASLRDSLLEKAAQCPSGSETVFREVLEPLASVHRFSRLAEYMGAVLFCIKELDAALREIRDSEKLNAKATEAIRFIQENYRKDITMASVSNHVMMNYSNFSILFNEAVGMGFAEYVRKVRIGKAKDLLDAGKRRITEVSDLVGYKNAKHFTRAFRQETGIAPVEYRDRLKANRM